MWCFCAGVIESSCSGLADELIVVFHLFMREGVEALLGEIEQWSLHLTCIDSPVFCTTVFTRLKENMIIMWGEFYNLLCCDFSVSFVDQRFFEEKARERKNRCVRPSIVFVLFFFLVVLLSVLRNENRFFRDYCIPIFPPSSCSSVGKGRFRHCYIISICFISSCATTIQGSRTWFSHECVVLFYYSCLEYENWY